MKNEGIKGKKLKIGTTN